MKELLLTTEEACGEGAVDFYEYEVKKTGKGLKLFFKSPLLHKFFKGSELLEGVRCFGHPIMVLPANAWSHKYSHSWGDLYFDYIPQQGTPYFKDYGNLGGWNFTWLRCPGIADGITVFGLDMVGDGLKDWSVEFQQKLNAFYKTFLMEEGIKVKVQIKTETAA